MHSQLWQTLVEANCMSCHILPKLSLFSPFMPIYLCLLHLHAVNHAFVQSLALRTVATPTVNQSDPMIHSSTSMLNAGGPLVSNSQCVNFFDDKNQVLRLSDGAFSGNFRPELRHVPGPAANIQRSCLCFASLFTLLYLVHTCDFSPATTQFQNGDLMTEKNTLESTEWPIIVLRHILHLPVQYLNVQTSEICYSQGCPVIEPLV
jgi:hypothetical protein